MRNTAAAREKYPVQGVNGGGCRVLRNLGERLWPFHLIKWGQKGRVDFEALVFVEVMFIKAGNIGS